MATLSHQIRVSAPPDRVYEAIATNDGVTEPFRWRFAELSPGARLRWDCTQGPGAAAGTTATFSLSRTADGRTQVDLDHDGFTESDPALATCNTLWGILLGHLKNYAETAVPSPAFE